MAHVVNELYVTKDLIGDNTEIRFKDNVTIADEVWVEKDSKEDIKAVDVGQGILCITPRMIRKPTLCLNTNTGTKLPLSIIDLGFKGKVSIYF